MPGASHRSGAKLRWSENPVKSNFLDIDIWLLLPGEYVGARIDGGGVIGSG